MPYKSIKELPAKIRKILPKKAQEVFMKVFNASYNKYGESTAFKIAWAAVKKKFVKRDGKWVLKSDVKVKKVKVNSELGDEKVYVDFVLTTPEVDSSKETFHKAFLDFIGTKLQGLKGDIEHANVLDLDLPKEWIAKIIDSKPIDGVVYATAILNNLHPMFNDVVTKIKRGELGASIEVAYDDDDYYLAEDGTRVYVDGEPIGFAFTENPKKSDAQILRLRKLKMPHSA